jgi:hypothetical protein
MMKSELQLLREENAALKEEAKRFKQQVVYLMPWVGVAADGPSWASAEVRANNKATCDVAFDKVAAFYPEPFFGVVE